MTIRPKHESDQDLAEVAFQLMKTLCLEHPEIEMTLWAAGCWSLLVDRYLASALTYKQFCREVENAKKWYKDRWEEE